MKFTSQETAKITLGLFENKLVYTYNSEVEADVKLPLAIELISEATMYSHQDNHLLDHCPQTLGYYWINDNKCLRTSKGLAFKTATSKKNGIQVTVTNDKLVIHQNIDWQQSTRPIDEKEYTFEKIKQLKATINKSEANEWYLMIGNRKAIILKDELEFFYKYESETGFEFIDGAISYYGKQLLNVDMDSFKVLNCNYAKDKNLVFCGGDAILGVDLATFKVLTHCIAKDINRVYYFSSILKHADAESLQLFDNPESLFFKDKNYVFEGENILIGADLDSFKVVGDIFGVDKYHVYRFSKRLKHVDVDTFEIINQTYFKDKHTIYSNIFASTKVCENHESFKDLGKGYYQLKDAIYHVDSSSQGKKISGDTINFEMLEYGWAKDSTTLCLNGESVFKGIINAIKILDGNYVIVNKKVFWRYEEIENADAETFEIDLFDFSMDKNCIYHSGEEIEGSSPSSFKQLDTFCFIDKNNVYLLEEYDSYFFLNHIKNIDTSSVEFIGSGYFKNKEIVYFNEKQLMGADPTSFTILQVGGYSHDKSSVYYLGKKLPKLNAQKLKLINYQFICDDKTIFFNDCELDLNAQKFTLLTDDFITDKEKVYFKNKLIKKADAESFEIINDWFQKDKYRLFHQMTPLELNIDTVKIENDLYAYDEHQAYFVNDRLKEIDIASFEVLGNNFARDKYHVYYMHEMLTDIDAPSFKIMGYSVYKDKNNIYTFKNGKLVIDGKVNF